MLMEILELLQQAAPTLAKGVGYTLLFALASMVGGLVLGFVLAVARIVPWRPIHWPAAVYVSMMRGTPLLVQIFVVYYGLPGIGIEFSPLTAGVLTLSLNAGAYLSESLRGAILGVTHGQWNASYSVGLTYFQTLRYIIVPQAVRNALPQVGNNLIALLKDTALVSVIGITELVHASQQAISETYSPFEFYITAAVIFYVLNLILEAGLHWMEKKVEAYR